MGIKHNYLNDSNKKPTSVEIDIAELVPNFANNTLWTKNISGTVIRLGEECADMDGGNSLTVYSVADIDLESGGSA